MRTTSVTSTNSDKNSKIFKMPNERGKKLPLVNMG